MAGGPGLPDAVVQRLTCATRIRTAVPDRDGTVLDLGRSHRLVSDRLYRALLLRDESCCTYPGCANTRELHVHHVRHADGVRTGVDTPRLVETWWLRRSTFPSKEAMIAAVRAETLPPQQSSKGGLSPLRHGARSTE